MKKLYIKPTVRTLYIQQTALIAGSFKKIEIGDRWNELESQEEVYDDEEYVGIFGD